MILSKFGQKFTQKSGILQLMDDLGQAISTEKPVNMLGGGNPATIPEANQLFESVWKTIEKDFLNYSGNYAAPQGDQAFIEALVDFFNRHYHWGLTTKNIALTNGSQNAFFYLFNLFSGPFADGSNKKILLPLAPEYIGYSDVHIDGSHFVSNKPEIDEVTYQDQEGFFKYRVDFDALKIDDSIGAICCSRPTNPTGNVLTDQEMASLSALAKAHNIPLIIDSAYGLPFPGILFTEATLTWDKHIVLSLSLSKIGLPGLRTGIIIAEEGIIQAVSSLNAIINLAPTRLGAALTTPLLADDQIKTLSQTSIKPFYQKKVDYAIALLKKELGHTPMKIHQPEGAIFLWLWFEGLPISTHTLYQQLKKNGTIILPGEYFFPGLEPDPNYRHRQECIRMSYAQSDETLEKGIADISQYVRAAYRAAH